MKSEPGVKGLSKIHEDNTYMFPFVEFFSIFLAYKLIKIVYCSFYESHITWLIVYYS